MSSGKTSITSLALAASIAGLAACGVFDSAESAPTPPAAGPDAGGGGEDAGLDGGGAAGTVLQTGFEAMSAQCAGWSVEAGSSRRVTGAHTGTYACELCTTVAGRAGAMLQRVQSASPGRYRLNVWARNPTPPAAPAPGLSAYLDLTSGQQRKLLNTPVGDDFANYTLDIDVESGPETLSITLFSSTTAGECIVVDDVTVTRTPL